MKNEQILDYVVITDLLPFMNKKFFNYVIYYLPKTISVSSHEVYYKDKLPFACMISFEDKESKDLFVNKFSNENYPNLSIKPNITNNLCVDDLKNIKDCINENLLVKFKCDYDKIADEAYEKNCKESGLVYSDYSVIEKQRESINYLVKKVGAQILKGESVMNISLPVFMFDERSLLETFAYEQSYASIYLNRAAVCIDKMERLKYVVTFIFANLHLSVVQTKPFTPIIGESCQLKIGDMEIYLENTVSKPPSINVYGISSLFKIYGNIALFAETGANSINAKKRGKLIVEFNDKDIYSIHIPLIYVNGILFGNRTFNYNSPLIVDSLNTGLSAYIKFNPDKKGFFGSLFGGSQKTFPDYVTGYIVETSFITIDTKNFDHKCKAKEKDYKETIEGEWTNYLQFGKTKYWSKEEYKIPTLSKQYDSNGKEKYIIPSDSSFRKDILAFKIDDKDESQKWKEEYEQIQRNDRELRKKFIKKK